MTIAIMALGVIGIIVQFIYREMQESEKPLSVVVTQYMVMLFIVLLSTYSQIYSSGKDKEYKQAKLEIDVLSKVSEDFYPIMENVIKIQNNFLTIKNYLSFEKAKKETPELSEAINWYKDASETHRSELEEGKSAFLEIQSIAAKIEKYSIEYEGILPAETISWAKSTSRMRFINIESYFDPFAPAGSEPKTSVLSYSKNTGEAFGAVMGKIKSAVNVIKTI